MKIQNQVDAQILSTLAAWWYYIALVLASLCYLLMLCVSGYGIIFEYEREFFMHLMIILGSLNGLAAVLLALRRKPLGALWCLFFVVFVGLASLDFGKGSGFTSNDIVPMIILSAAPTLMLLSQFRTLKKAAGLGPGWGVGELVPSKPNRPIARASVWWFRIACTLSLLFYLGITAGSAAWLINDPPRSIYSVYLAIIAGANGLYAVILTFRKNMTGSIWSFAACFFLGLGMIDIGLGKPLRHYTSNMLPFAIVVTFMLLSQLLYLKKLRQVHGDGLQKARVASGAASKVQGGGFQKAHFVNGAALSEQDLAELYRVWSSYSLSFGKFFLPGFALALIIGHLLSKSVGGFIGNILAVALLLGMMLFGLLMSLKLKKRYLACLGKLGLTAEEVQQALRHKKKGTVATGAGN